MQTKQISAHAIGYTAPRQQTCNLVPFGRHVLATESVLDKRSSLINTNAQQNVLGDKGPLDWITLIRTWL